VLQCIMHSVYSPSSGSIKSRSTASLSYPAFDVDALGIIAAMLKTLRERDAG
jgi:hypothetical protein